MAPSVAAASPTTVNPVQTSTYTLTNATDPTTFGAQTSIRATGDAVVGDNSTNWTVTNQGLLQGANGVVLQSFSTLVNSGTISGAGAVVDPFGANVTNAGGVINGAVTLGASSANGSTVDDSGGGRINGSVTLGAGNDLVIADFGGSADPIKGISGRIDAGGGLNTLELVVTTSAGTTFVKPAATFQELSYGIGDGATLTLAPGVYRTSTLYLANLVGGGQFVNDGTLETTGPAIAAAGVNVNGGPVSVLNKGVITATLSSGEYAIEPGVYDIGGITNTGKLTAVGGGGIAEDLNSYPIINSGTITADAIGIDAFDSVVTNSGVIHSNGSIGLSLFGNEGSPATNTGVIYGKTAGADISGYTLTNSGVISSPSAGVGLEPYGTLVNLAGGDVNGGIRGLTYGFTFNASVDNAGTINGNVNLGDFPSPYGSNNTYIARPGGVLNGNLVLGSGNDLFVTSLINTGPGAFAGVTGKVTGAGVDSLRYLVTSDASSSLALPSLFGSVTYDLANNAKLTLSVPKPPKTPLSFAGTGSVDLTANLASQNNFDLILTATSMQTTSDGKIVPTDLDVTSHGVLSVTHNNSFYADDPAVLMSAGSFTNDGTIIAQDLAPAPPQFGAPPQAAVAGGGLVVNNGKIELGLADGAQQQGADTLSVTNNGSITQLAGAGDSRGIVGAVSVVNTGSIAVGGAAVIIGGTGATLTNSGLIESTHATAVSVTGFNGGSIVNQRGGSIAGLVYGISVNSGGTVTNAGQVIGGTAVFLGENFGGASTSVVNQAGGSIAGQDFGVSTVSSASITNAGTISGATALALGATFGSPGSALVNQTGGAIVGKTIGVSFVDGGVVTNAGSISGGVDAIAFGAGDATLALQTGSVLSGTVVASTGFSNSLILQGSGSAANQFVNFSTLQVQGAGVWTLGGASSIGATEVKAGALVLTGTLTSAFTIDAGATLQSASQNLLATGALVDNGLLIFDETKSGTFANAITGSGGVGVAGGGTLTLSGATSVTTTEVGGGALVVTGTLASAMTIDPGGTLQGGAANLAPSGAVVDAGTLVLDQPIDASFGAAIDGPGALVKQNAGALTLTGSSEVATTEVKAGSLLVSGRLISGFTIDSGATLEGSLGAIVPVGVVADNGSLVLDQPTDLTLLGSIEGTGALTKNDAGALTLAADSAVAATTVNGGALILGDAAHPSTTLTSAVTIAAGGALGGHGTIIGSLANGGVVSPGGSFGVLTVNGAYTQSSTGLLSLEIAASQNSSLRVMGAATLGGALTVTIDPGAYRKGQQFDLLTAGSISGAFGDVDFVGPGAFNLSTQGSTLVAYATVGNATLSGATANERAILAAFNNYPIGVSDFDPLANALLGLNPGSAQNRAFDQLGGEVLADLTTAGRDGLRAMMGDVAEQLDTRPQGNVSDPMWLTGYGRFASVGRQSDAQGFSNDASGVRGGLQRDFGPATTLGVAVGYETSSVNLDGLPQSGRLDQTTFGVFGEQRWGSVYADLGGFGAYDGGSEHRTILAPGIGRNANGGFSGDAGGIDASIGDRLALGSGWTLAPRAGVTWSRVDQGAFTESGASGADLAVAASHQDATQGLLGARLAHSADFAGGVLDADVSADWAHDFQNPTPHTAESFAAAAGTGFDLVGADPGRDAGLVRADIAYHVARLSIFASFDGSFSREETQGAVEGGLRVTW